LRNEIELEKDTLENLEKVMKIENFSANFPANKDHTLLAAVFCFNFFCIGLFFHSKTYFLFKPKNEIAKRYWRRG